MKKKKKISTVNDNNSEEDSNLIHVFLHDCLFYWQVKMARRPIIY